MTISACGPGNMSMSRSISIRGPDTVSVPTVALQTGQKGPFVFVVEA